MRKWTLEEVSEYCDGRGIDVISYGQNMRAYSVFYCRRHKTEWTTKFYKIKHGNRGCPVCRKEKVAKHRSTPLEVAEKICKDAELTLVRYSGVTRARKSIVMCNTCDHVWEVTLDSIKSQGTRCPLCAIKYRYEGISFDSSWELIFYLYMKEQGQTPQRICGHDKNHVLEYTSSGKVRKWYPDFLIDGKYYEIKALDFRVLKRRKSSYYQLIAAKMAAYPDIIWVTDKEIQRMSKVVGGVGRYRHAKLKKGVEV